MKALGAYFEVLRGDRGRAALAADVGISEMSIWRIEDGSQEPRAELLNALVRTLRARWSDVEKLLSDSDATAEDGRQLAISLRSRLEQADSADMRKQEINRLIDELERDPKKLDRLIGYGERLLEEDRERGAH